MRIVYVELPTVHELKLYTRLYTRQDLPIYVHIAYAQESLHDK